MSFRYCPWVVRMASIPLRWCVHSHLLLLLHWSIFSAQAGLRTVLVIRINQIVGLILLRAALVLAFYQLCALGRLYILTSLLNQVSR